MAASEAISAAMSVTRPSWRSQVTDLPVAIGSPSRYLVNDLYNALLRRDTGLCGLYVRIGEGLSFHSWGERLEDTGRIRSFILARDPDVVVVVSPWVLRPVARAMEGTGVPVISVVVDLGRGLPLGWVCNDVAKCIVPTEAARDYMVRRGLDPGLIEMGGMIVHPRFIGNGNGRGEEGSVLLMAGLHGTRTTDHLARHLLRSRTISRLRVMCGRNARLLQDLSEIDDDRLVPQGYVSDMLPFYREARVVVTKCGAATLAECIATQRPLVVDATCGVMPQEIGNVDLVRGEGVGVVGRTVEEVAGHTDRLLEDTGRFEDLRRRSARAGSLLGTHRVVDGIVREVEGR